MSLSSSYISNVYFCCQYNHFLLKQKTNEPKKNHLCATIAEVRLIILIRCALAAFLTQATSTAVSLSNINIMLIVLFNTTTIIIIIISKDENDW